MRVLISGYSVSFELIFRTVLVFTSLSTCQLRVKYLRRIPDQALVFVAIQKFLLDFDARKDIMAWTWLLLSITGFRGKNKIANGYVTIMLDIYLIMQILDFIDQGSRAADRPKFGTAHKLAS